jgi:pSer/pThr/pTyr-binding forkhead associated (FHA) protein
VQAVWDETESGHTMVTPRVNPGQTAPAFNPNDTVVERASDVSSDGEQTVVRPKAQALYSVEIWRSGVREAVVPIAKNEITIGRGSRSITVDLPIKGDPEVSRVHAVLSRDNQGRYWIVAKGRNPTVVNGKELPREEPTEVAPDQRIAICNFVLRIQPQ